MNSLVGNFILCENLDKFGGHLETRKTLYYEPISLLISLPLVIRIQPWEYYTVPAN